MIIFGRHLSLLSGRFGPVVAIGHVRLKIERSNIRILHWPNVSFSGRQIKFSRLHSTNVWIGTLRGRCLCNILILLGEVCWLQTNRQLNSFNRSRKFLNVAQWSTVVNVKFWRNSWKRSYQNGNFKFNLINKMSLIKSCLANESKEYM